MFFVCVSLSLPKLLQRFLNVLILNSDLILKSLKALKTSKKCDLFPKQRSRLDIQQVSPACRRSTSVFSFCLQFVAVYQWRWVCAELLSQGFTTTPQLWAASNLSMAAVRLMATTSIPRTSVRPHAVESQVLSLFSLLKFLSSWASCVNY